MSYLHIEDYIIKESQIVYVEFEYTSNTSAIVKIYLYAYDYPIEISYVSLDKTKAIYEQIKQQLVNESIKNNLDNLEKKVTITDDMMISYYNLRQYLTSFTCSILREYQIMTIGELYNTKPIELVRKPKIGKKSIKDIYEMFQDNGYDWLSKDENNVIYNAYRS